MTNYTLVTGEFITKETFKLFAQKTAVLKPKGCCDHNKSQKESIGDRCSQRFHSKSWRRINQQIKKNPLEDTLQNFN